MTTTSHLCLISTYIYIYYVWVNYNDLTATSLESWLIRGIIPTWPYFRSVNYFKKSQYISIYIHIYIYLFKWRSQMFETLMVFNPCFSTINIQEFMGFRRVLRANFDWVNTNHIEKRLNHSSPIV